MAYLERLKKLFFFFTEENESHQKFSKPYRNILNFMNVAYCANWSNHVMEPNYISSIFYVYLDYNMQGRTETTFLFSSRERGNDWFFDNWKFIFCANWNFMFFTYGITQLWNLQANKTVQNKKVNSFDIWPTTDSRLPTN